MELPTEWFGDEPGSLTDSEVRLYAALLLHHAPENEINGWVSAVLSMERSASSSKLLPRALGQRRLARAAAASSVACASAALD